MPYNRSIIFFGEGLEWTSTTNGNNVNLNIVNYSNESSKEVSRKLTQIEKAFESIYSGKTSDGKTVTAKLSYTIIDKKDF